MITLKQLTARREALLAQRQRLLEQIEAASANVSAFNGAIEEVSFWISVHTKAESELDQALENLVVQE